MKNIKFNKKILLIPIILGLFVLGWYVKEEKAKNEELIRVFEERQEKNETEKIDTSDWKTYRNDYYGYQISYPKDWDVSVEDDRDVGLFKIPRSDTMILHITKDCDLQQVREHKQYGTCPDSVNIRTGQPMDTIIVKNKAEKGELSITVSKAFHGVFALKEGEIRESLEYNKQSSCYIYDGEVRCDYSFINDDIYFEKGESWYSISVKDKTKERKTMKIKKEIIDSLRLIKKLEK
ncbi:MAG: hypothetical protein U9O20_03685 [Patescibacteria group bacterium]|nr:hypothetical protein [Patescibacteria group bacterium]